MKVSRLIVYPIKSLGGIELPSARITKHGFPYDRTFMLLKDKGTAESDQTKRYLNMQIDKFYEMGLFTTAFDDSGQSSVTVTFSPPVRERRTISIPLEPDTSNLSPFKVTLHSSTTNCHRMYQQYSDWFSECFGYDVVLVYLGGNHRPILFSSLSPKATNGQSWLTQLTGGLLGSNDDSSPEKITFADVAPYLVVSETSLAAVSEKLPADQAMDMTKFRPNIVVSGANEHWEEDYWAGLDFSSLAASDGTTVSLSLQHNCVRCQSINVDYRTGKRGTDASGQVLKLLQKDRRVDPGMKWSPVFGRYGFLSGVEGKIAVGDEVVVTARNEERTIFDWPL